MSSNKIYKFSTINPIVGLIGFAIVVIGLFWVTKVIFKILLALAPFLLIAALFINYRVVLGYIKWLMGSVKRNPVFGIFAILFTIVGFPLVTGFLFFRALATRGVSSTMNPAKGEFIKYENVKEDFLDLSELNEHKKKMDNDYNDIVK